MKLINIQKKPPFYRELLMVFIISLYKLYISIPYGAIKSKAIATKMDAKKDFNSLWCD